jgi:hypothetical protein
MALDRTARLGRRLALAGGVLIALTVWTQCAFFMSTGARDPAAAAESSCREFVDSVDGTIEYQPGYAECVAEGIRNPSQSMLPLNATPAVLGLGMALILVWPLTAIVERRRRSDARA